MKTQRTIIAAAVVLSAMATGLWPQASGAQGSGGRGTGQRPPVRDTATTGQRPPARDTSVAGQRPQASGPRPQARSSDTGWSSAHIDRAMRLRADSLRTLVLQHSSWVGFASAPCATGDVRSFERDTLGIVRRALARLEFLVLSYGAYVPLNTASGRALLRAVVRLETGGPAPRWDVLSGTAPRVLNAILPASMYNPETKQCVQTPGVVPHGIVLPDVEDFTPPRDSGATNFAVSYGPKGLNTLRDYFASTHRGDTSAVFRHTRVIAHALWQDYAIIAVQRDAERAGSIPLPSEGTGATYAFHRVGGEWRVLALIRNW